MEYNNDQNDREEIYSKPVRAGKRTYFFDVKSTKGEDLFLTITESKKRFREDGSSYYEKHKIFLYKEDFNKFIKALAEAVDHVKTDLMPDFDFDAFNHENDGEGDDQYGPEVREEAVAAPVVKAEAPYEPGPDTSHNEEVDKW